MAPFLLQTATLSAEEECPRVWPHRQGKSVAKSLPQAPLDLSLGCWVEQQLQFGRITRRVDPPVVAQQRFDSLTHHLRNVSFDLEGVN